MSAIVGSHAKRHDPEEGHGPKDGRAADEIGIAQNQPPPLHARNEG
jgi:hypothetical protein